VFLHCLLVVVGVAGCHDGLLLCRVVIPSCTRWPPQVYCCRRGVRLYGARRASGFDGIDRDILNGEKLR
jgi:hypothetical protein